MITRHKKRIGFVVATLAILVSASLGGLKNVDQDGNPAFMSGNPSMVASGINDDTQHTFPVIVDESGNVVGDEDTDIISPDLTPDGKDVINSSKLLDKQLYAAGAVIGVDARHGFDSTTFLATGSDFDTFRATIIAAGHTILPKSSFESGDLTGLNALILKQPYTQNSPGPFSSSEITAIHNFVNNGNGLLIVADGGSGSYALVSNLNLLAAPHGVMFASSPSEGSGHIISSFVAHDVTTGISSIGVDYQRRLVSIVAPAIDLTTGGGADDALAAVNGTAGAGNVVLLSDSSLWADSDTASDYPITYGSNQLLLQNIIAYITTTTSPTPWPIVFDFLPDREEWTSGSAPVVFSEPDFSWEPGYLKITSSTNTNTFGFWQSPQDAIPADAGYLYRARFTVSTDVAQPEIVPQIRLRVNARNLQQADCLTISSSGDGGASPGAAGTTYDLYFVPPTNAGYCMLAFDLLNFNPYDAAHAELALESVLVERFGLDTLDESTTITWTYDFETSQEFWFPGDGTYAFTDPESFWAEGALHLRSMTNTNTFGFWHNDGVDVIVEEDCLYRGTFEVRTDEPDRSRVPQMRLRFNTANMQAARTLEISSSGDGANSPGTTNTTYDRLYFLPPANCVGKGLIISFDILNFSPDDAPTASLILDRAIIETIEPPALP